MLIDRQLFETVDLVKQSIERLQKYKPPEGYYLAFSGGKDSIVIYDLAVKAGVKFDAHFHITTVDPPELMRYIRKYYPDVERTKPRLNMWQLIEEKRMPPLRQARYCCEELKEGGGEGRTVITGIRWAESDKRRNRKIKERCLRSKNKNFIHPIIDWTDKDVWEYIHMHNMPYCSLYDEGFKRIGCIGCPCSTKRKEQFKRWPGFERAYKRAFQKCIDANSKKPDDNWKDGEAMFRWWMDDSSKKTNDDQLVLFE